MRVKIIPRQRRVCKDNKNVIDAASRTEDSAIVKDRNGSPGATEHLGPSTDDMPVNSYESKARESLASNDLDVIDLSMKKQTLKNVDPDDEFKGTFLYRIMTDPEFLENIRRNKQIKAIACPFCEQTFERENELVDHLDTRKVRPSHVCCACGKTFACKRYLRYHQRRHTDKNKFTCKICLKEYSRLDNLLRHNTFHTNPDKFSCSACDRTFTRKDLLNKHQQSHENKFRYHCDVCQKYFKGRLSLENHRKRYWHA